jgi:hypothetical protein
MSVKRVSIQCPNCNNTVNAIVHSIIDPSEDIEAKMRLLAGNLNIVRCPNCGAPISMAAPILYHDAEKELLISYVPMEINMPRQQQEKAVGDLLRELTAKIPNEMKKGYLFQPKSALTMQGLIEMVLQADGVTPEMMEEQRARARLVETFMQTPDEELPGLVEANDASLDAQFFSTMTLMAQRLLQDGQRDLAEHVVQTQQAVMAISTFGKEMVEKARVQEEVVQEIALEIQGLGANAGREDFLDLAFKYADDEDRLQALVGLVRPAFDYQFFQELTAKIGEAPSYQRDALQNLRDRLLELTAMIDQQTQLAVREAASFLRALLESPNADALIAANIGMIDDTFMAVLQANIQESERQGDAQTSARLKDAYNRVVSALRQNMQPELRFINELLGETDENARQMVQEQAGQYGQPLLEMFDTVEEILNSRGDTALLERLSYLREEAANVIG